MQQIQLPYWGDYPDRLSLHGEGKGPHHYLSARKVRKWLCPQQPSPTAQVNSNERLQTMFCGTEVSSVLQNWQIQLNVCFLKPLSFGMFYNVSISRYQYHVMVQEDLKPSYPDAGSHATEKRKAQKITWSLPLGRLPRIHI